MEMSAAQDVNFGPFEERMRREGLEPIVIENFRHYYTALVGGETGLVPEKSIAPVDSLPRLQDLGEYAEAGRAALGQAVILKLNGGLGTSMGLERAKSLLAAREGTSFLEIIVRQTLATRARHNAPIPLIFMNSFSTDADTRAVLDRFPELHGPIPETMLQHKVPKVLQDGLGPAEWPAEPELEWCPPGHGEVYITLVTSGLLEALLAGGHRYLFISNADNLGATMDLALLGYFAQGELPFLMEVAGRTEADKKGGHLARLRANDRLTLREVAQCPPDDIDAFQDVARHRYFNTNNIWVNLVRLKATLDAHANVVALPMIRNSKTVDPRDGDSPKVYQLETAMGAAIEVFEGAGAVEVPRSRFVPVKTCADLLALRSDLYTLDEDATLRRNPARTGPDLVVKLDDAHYKLIDAFEARFPEPVPSLIGCARLTVEGDVRFEPGSVFRGEVTVVNPSGEQRTLPPSTLEDETRELA
jgi:UTP--glucose-1-phosphate uridylyltransferase